MKRPIHHLTRAGWVVATAVFVLLLIGLASIYAAKSVAVGTGETPGKVFAAKQLAHAVVSLVAVLFVLRMGYMRIGQRAYPIFALGLVLLVPLASAKIFHTELGGLTPCLRGAYRSIHLPGISLQPSEFMKVAYILALAWYLRFRKNYRKPGGLVVPFLLSLVPMTLILLEPDLGTVLLFFPVLFGMLYVAGAKVSHLAIIMAAGLAATPVLWTQIKPYQKLRVSALLLQSEHLRANLIANPERYAFLDVDKREAMEWKASSGMQLVRSKAALGSGGLIGQGWGHGTYVEYNFLPDRHNDFVFALVGHQWGLVGCLIVLCCYVAIVLAGVEIATVTTEPFGRLLAMGVVCLFSAQALINIGMTIGLMPITGMTLPFVSYGGSSLLTNSVAVALLISVSQYRPFSLANKPFDWW